MVRGLYDAFCTNPTRARASSLTRRACTNAYTDGAELPPSVYARNDEAGNAYREMSP